MPKKLSREDVSKQEQEDVLGDNEAAVAYAERVVGGHRGREGVHQNAKEAIILFERINDNVKKVKSIIVNEKQQAVRNHISFMHPKELVGRMLRTKNYCCRVVQVEINEADFILKPSVPMSLQRHKMGKIKAAIRVKPIPDPESGGGDGGNKGK